MTERKVILGFPWQAAVNPTANEDVDSGFIKPMQWLNTVTKELFELMDDSVGAAVWKSLSDHYDARDLYIADPADGAYVVSLYAPFACTLASLIAKTAVGTASLAVDIGGTPVTGLTAVAASGTKSSTNSSGANTVAKGAVISVTLSSSSMDLAGLSLAIVLTK